MYKLKFDKKALNFLNNQNKIQRKEFGINYKNVKTDPFRYLEHLTQIKGYKLRVGNYRIIIDIQEEIKILSVEKIGHRKNVY